MNVGGIVLCGGESKRMGRAKADLPFAGDTMLGRIVGILASVVDPVVVVAAPGQNVHDLPRDVSIIGDAHANRGPLEGLAAGLEFLAGRVDAAYASSCDVPFLKPAFVRRVIALLDDADACVPHVTGFQHSLAAVYRTQVAAQVRLLLASNERRLSRILDHIRVRQAVPSDFSDVDPELSSLWNVNTPADYEAALRRHQAEKDGKAAGA